MHSEQFQLHADIELRHWWFVARRRIMRRLVAQVLPPSRETTVVDVGCGTGANVAALADQYACVGVDTSAQAVALARQRFPEVQFRVGRAPQDVGDLMQTARLFLLMDVLEHVPDDFAMLSELLAAAAPQSLFLMTVPAEESLWSEHDESFGHYRRYDRGRLERLWAGLPVTARLISYFNARTYPMIRAVRAWNRFRGRAAGRAGTDFWIPAGPINRLLAALFAGEGKVLEDVLQGRRPSGYRVGASLIALVERGDGPLAVRTRPPDCPADRRTVRETLPACPA